MFDSISRRYDFLNHFLSMGIDRRWRKKAIACLRARRPAHILDMATGTGDLALEALSLQPQKITGVDLSEGMLEIGRKKIREAGKSSAIELLKGDSENLSFADHTFDACTVGFGVRNFEDLDKGLAEIHRVLKPGAMFVVLEFSKPKAFPVRQLYQFYFNTILPFWGRYISKNQSAYSYLPESVRHFPDGKQFTAHLEKAGFRNTTMKALSLGICSIYTGVK